MLPNPRNKLPLASYASPHGTVSDALKNCNITNSDGSGLTWYSSLYDGKVMTKERLSPQYLVDNMTQAILFDQALKRSPALETLKEVGSRSLYSGIVVAVIPQ